MPFWGSSNTQKEAQGFPREYGAWNFDQYKNMLGQQNQLASQAGSLDEWAKNYNLNRVNQGFGTPQDIRAQGQQVMPGVDEAIARRSGRLDQMQQGLDQVPKAQQTTDQINSNLDQQGQNIGSNYDAIQGDINGTYGRMRDINSNANKDITGNISGMYDALEGNTNNVYGEQRGNNQRTYDQLLNDAGGSYGTAQQQTEMLRPGSEFQQAQTARSYAPEISATAGRLRRAGVDPNSIQASSVLQGAERDRARGMDDAAARGTQDYVSAKNALTLGQEQANERLGQAKLNNEIGLGTSALNTNNALGQNRLGAFTSEVQRNLGNEQGTAANNLADSTKNRDTSFQRGQDLLGQRNQSVMNNRGMAQNDWQTQAGLLQNQNDNELTGLNLLDTQYQRGLQNNTNNLTERNAAAGALANQAQQSYGNEFNAARTAQGYGGAAQNAYGQAYQYEAPNANWGGKLLGGIAAAGLNMLAPGTGNILTGAMGGGQQQGGQRGNGSQGGGQGWPGYPYAMSAQQYDTSQPIWGGVRAQSSSSPWASSSSPWDPSKTQTLANGSLQVGRY